MDIIIICSKECLFSDTTKNSVESCIQELNNLPDENKITLTTRCYDLREIEHQNVATQVRKSKVQIVIITQRFLAEVEHLMHKTSSCYLHLKRILNTKGVIAILTGVSQEEINNSGSPPDGKLFPYLNRWSIIERPATKKPDPEFTQNFTELLIRNYNMNIRYDKPKIPFPPSSSSSSRKSSQISTCRKISRTVLDAEASTYDSSMTTENWLNESEESENLNTNFEIKDNVLSIQFLNDLEPKDEIIVQVRRENVVYTSSMNLTEIINERLFNIPMENLFSEKLDGFVENLINKFPEYKKYLDEQLESTLSIYLKKFATEDFVLNGPAPGIPTDLFFPTPMHFAGYYGLERFVFCLLEKGKGLEMCEVKNNSGQTPMDLMKEQGYDETLGKLIRDNKDYVYMLKAIQFVKKFITQTSYGNSEETEEQASNVKETSDEGGYSDEDDDSDSSEDLEVLPPDLPPKLPEKSRRINPDNYSIPSNRPVKPVRHNIKAWKEIESKDGYLLPGNGNTLERFNQSPIRKESVESYTTSENESGAEEEEEEYNKPVPVFPPNLAETTPGTPRPISILQPSTLLDPLEQELIAIMRQVANREIDSSEVDFILKELNKRKDVKESLKEKHKQVERLTEEYFEMQNSKGNSSGGKGTKVLNRIASVFKHGRKKASIPDQPTSTFFTPSPPERDNTTNPFDFAPKLEKKTSIPIPNQDTSNSLTIKYRRHNQEQIQSRRRPGTFILRKDSEFNMTPDPDTNSLDSGDYTTIWSNSSGTDINDFRLSEQTKSNDNTEVPTGDERRRTSSTSSTNEHENQILPIVQKSFTEEELPNNTLSTEDEDFHQIPPPRPPKKNPNKKLVPKLCDIQEGQDMKPCPPVPIPRKRVQKVDVKCARSNYQNHFT